MIPLKSKSVSKNWDTTCRNLSSTVSSVTKQTNRSFCSVVVGHDKPNFIDELKTTDQCSFIHYDEFPPPIDDACEADNQLRYEFDRCTKILKGIIYLGKRHPDITHWFSLDADDIISKNFVETIARYKESDSIILEKGYVYFKSSGIINTEDEFSSYCGSSAVLSRKLFNEMPDEIDRSSYKLIPFGAISHVHMKLRLVEMGYSVSVPEERIVMYVRDNGENISNAAYCNTFAKKIKKNIKMILKARKVSGAVKSRFGL